MFDFRKTIKLLSVAAAAILMVSCGNKGEKATSATKGNMIPDNAVIAMKVDADQLWNKALGDEGSDMRNYWNMGKSMLSMSAGELGEVGDVVRQILKDPAALGVCMEEPMVLSVAADLVDVYNEEVDVEVCLVALLDDSGAFVNVVDAVMDVANEEGELGMSKEVVSDSYTYYSAVIDEGVSLDLGVSAESAVLRIKADMTSKNQDLKTSMLGLFAEGGPERTEGIDAFYASKADLAMWMDFEGVIEMARPVLESEEPAVIAQLDEYMPMYEGASMVSDLTFKDGQTVLQISMFGSEQMKAYSAKYNAVSSDKYFDYLPATSALVVNVALKDFAGLVSEMCKSNKELADGFEYLEEELGIDDELLAGFPGVITFALDGQGLGDRQIPGMVLLMDCEENVWEFIETYLEMYAEEVKPDEYNLLDMFYIAYADGTLSAASDMEVSIASFGDTILSRQLEKGGMIFDLASLPPHILNDFAQEIDGSISGEELLEYLSSVVLTNTPDHMTATLTLNMDDKEHNLLEKVLLYAVNSAF